MQNALHSNLVIFKFNDEIDGIEITKTLHSNLVIFK